MKQSSQFYKYETTLCNFVFLFRKDTYYINHLLLHWSSPSILAIPLWPAIEQDMGLWPMYSIMHPSSTLLDSKRAPFCFRHETPFGDLFRYLWRKNHVPIFVYVVIVSFRVLNTVGCHIPCYDHGNHDCIPSMIRLIENVPYTRANEVGKNH